MNRFRLLLLAVAWAGGAAQAQMVGDLDKDSAILEQLMQPAIAATGKNDQEASRLAMEELYRQWRTFRRMNIEGHPEDKQLAADLDAIEARLWAASLAVDDGKLSDANTELGAARILLMVLRERYKFEPAAPAASWRADPPQARGLHGAQAA